MSQRRLIVDAHAHVFKRVRGTVGAGAVRGRRYGVVDIGGRDLQFMPPLNRLVCHTVEMLMQAMDWAGVQRAVLLQGPFYGECNDYVLQAASAHGDRLLAAAYFDPWSEDAAHAIEEIASAGMFKAVKLELSEETGLVGIHPDALLSDSRLLPLWSRLADEGLVLTLDLGKIGSRSYQTDAVRAIAEAFPSLRIVIAHLAQPSSAIFSDKELAELWSAQLSLGRLANVWFDTASLITYFPSEKYPYPTMARVLREAVAIAGPDRIMWGSDIPSTYQWSTYPDVVEAFTSQIAFLNAHDQALFCGGTALAVYGS